MIKFKKPFYRITVLLVGISLVSSTTAVYPSSSKDFLRVPMNIGNFHNRMNKAANEISSASDANLDSFDDANIGKRVVRYDWTSVENKYSVLDPKTKLTIEEFTIYPHPANKLKQSLEKLKEDSPEKYPEIVLGFTALIDGYLKLNEQNPDRAPLCFSSFNAMVRDFFGGVTPGNKHILIHEYLLPKLGEDFNAKEDLPRCLALFHEIGHYLILRDGLKLVYDDTAKTITVQLYNQLSDSWQSIIVPLSGTMLDYLTKENWPKEALKSNHYLLRLLQEEMFPELNHQLTALVQQKLAEEKPKEDLVDKIIRKVGSHSWQSGYSYDVHISWRANEQLDIDQIAARKFVRALIDIGVCQEGNIEQTAQLCLLLRLRFNYSEAKDFFNVLTKTIRIAHKKKLDVSALHPEFMLQLFTEILGDPKDSEERVAKDKSMESVAYALLSLVEHGLVQEGNLSQVESILLEIEKATFFTGRNDLCRNAFQVISSASQLITNDQLEELKDLIILITQLVPWDKRDKSISSIEDLISTCSSYKIGQNDDRLFHFLDFKRLAEIVRKNPKNSGQLIDFYRSVAIEMVSQGLTHTLLDEGEYLEIIPWGAKHLQFLRKRSYLEDVFKQIKEKHEENTFLAKFKEHLLDCPVLAHDSASVNSLINATYIDPHYSEEKISILLQVLSNNSDIIFDQDQMQYILDINSKINYTYQRSQYCSLAALALARDKNLISVFIAAVEQEDGKTQESSLRLTRLAVIMEKAVFYNNELADIAVAVLGGKEEDIRFTTVFRKAIINKLRIAFEEANNKLDEDRRVDEDFFEKRCLDLAWKLELMLPGSSKHLSSLLEKGAVPQTVLRFLESKQKVLYNQPVKQAFANYMQRFKNIPGRKKVAIPLTEMFRLLNIANSFIYIDKAECFIEELDAIDISQKSDITYNRFVVLFLQNFAAFFGIDSNMVAPEVYKKLYLPFLNRLTQAAQHIENYNPKRLPRFRGLIKAMIEDQYRAFIESEEQTDPIGRAIAAHNKTIRNSLQKLGIQIDRWLGWEESNRFQPGSFMYYEKSSYQYDPVSDIDVVMDYMVRAANLEHLTQPQKDELIVFLGTLGLNFEYTSIAEDKPKKFIKLTLAAKNKIHKDVYEVFTDSTNIDKMQSLFQKLINSSEVQSTVEILETLTHLKEKINILKSRMSDSEYAQSLGKVRKYFSIRPILRNPGHDLFIGDFTDCCLAMSSAIHPEAMVDRLIDEGFNIIEVIDQATQKTIACLWLYIAEDGSLVIQNIEINSEYERTAPLKDKIGEEMVAYACHFKEYIRAKRNLIGQVEHGKYMGENGFVQKRYKKTVFGQNKAGGSLGHIGYYLDSEGKPEAYLVKDIPAAKDEVPPSTDRNDPLSDIIQHNSETIQFNL
jgi:hypothetical protein